jgi:hypothetical protein
LIILVLKVDDYICNAISIVSGYWLREVMSGGIGVDRGRGDSETYEDIVKDSLEI